MTNNETDFTMAPPWWRISSSSGRRHGDMDDGDDDDTDDDTDDEHDNDDDTDDDNDHKNDSYTAAGAALAFLVQNVYFNIKSNPVIKLDFSHEIV